MKADQHSRTAESAAAIRAAHFLEGPPFVLEDPFAIELTSPRLRNILKHDLLRTGMRTALGEMGRMLGQILVRGRYAEDRLERAVNAGIRQYVLVGAGFDTFAFRRKDLMNLLTVYELDHPATQNKKMERLSRLGLDFPKGLEFVPIDFETDTVASALGRTGYSTNKKTFFSWLGVVPYLTEASVFSTLESIAAISKGRSEIAFDFAAPPEYARVQDLKALTRLSQRTARMGEPLRSVFEPDSIVSSVCELGFELVETMSPEEQDAHYFSNRSGWWRTIPIEFLAHFRRVDL